VAEAPARFSTLPDLDLESAINSALERIPPLWPLKHFVAVNPFVGLADQPFSKACALLQRVVGAAPLQPPADYFRAFQEGRIRPQDLAAAADDDWTVLAAFEAVKDAVMGQYLLHCDGRFHGPEIHETGCIGHGTLLWVEG
jgi:hypothetical protein